jgi:hypothetical protein
MLQTNMKYPIVPLAVFWILLFGFLVRAQTFRAPVFDHHNWRQADTAQIARNFWRERFNPFFPQVDQRGAQEHGYVETGLEIYAFAMACVARVAGFYPQIGRVLNSLLFVGSGLLLFRFLRRRYDASAALIGLFVYAFGLPLSLFLDRAVMNEPTLMFLSFACLVSAQTYLVSRRWHAAAGLIVASALLGAIKFPYLIVWGPVFGLFLEHDGRGALRRWLPYIVAVADLAAAWLWYSHAHRLGQLTGLSFGLLDKAFDRRLVLSFDFYLTLVERLAKDILGPVGVAAAAVGLIVAVRRRLCAEVLGIAAFAAYVVLVAAGNSAHDYYQVAVVPVAVVLVVIGVRDGIRVVSRTDRGYVTGVTFVLAAMLLSTFVRSVSFHSWYEYDLDRVQMCRDLQPQLQSRDLVVFLDYPSPDLLFCLDRHGWLFEAGRWTASDLFAVWRQGAAVLVVPSSVPPAAIPRAVKERSALIAHSGHLAAYRLEPLPRDLQGSR